MREGATCGCDNVNSWQGGEITDTEYAPQGSKTSELYGRQGLLQLTLVTGFLQQECSLLFNWIGVNEIIGMPWQNREMGKLSYQ